MFRFSLLAAAHACSILLVQAFADAGNGGIGTSLDRAEDILNCAAAAYRSCASNLGNCVAALCTDCTRYTEIATCCNLPTPELRLQCLVDAVENPSFQPASTRTATLPPTTVESGGPNPSITRTPVPGGLRACLRLESIVLSCEARRPGFALQPFRSKASCLCYSSGTYNPGPFDEAFSTCLEFVSAVDAKVYGVLTSAYPGGFDSAPCRRDVVTAGSVPTSAETGSIQSSTEASSSQSTLVVESTTSPSVTAAPSSTVSQPSQTSSTATAASASATGAGTATEPELGLFIFAAFVLSTLRL